MVVTILMFSIIWILTEIFMKDDIYERGHLFRHHFEAVRQFLAWLSYRACIQSTGMAPLMIVAAVPLFNIFAVVVLTFKARTRECR